MLSGLFCCQLCIVSEVIGERFTVIWDDTQVLTVSKRHEVVQRLVFWRYEMKVRSLGFYKKAWAQASPHEQATDCINERLDLNEAR